MTAATVLVARSMIWATGSAVNARVKIGKTWTTLPDASVESDGTLTLPALTCAKAGTYPFKLTLANGATRYVKVKVKRN